MDIDTTPLKDKVPAVLSAAIRMMARSGALPRAPGRENVRIALVDLDLDNEEVNLLAHFSTHSDEYALGRGDDGLLLDFVAFASDLYSNAILREANQPVGPHTKRRDWDAITRGSI